MPKFSVAVKPDRTMKRILKVGVMEKGENWSTETLFADLEADFKKAESRRRAKMNLSVVAMVSGLFVIFAGLSSTFWISVAGYVMVLWGTLNIVNSVRDKIGMKVAEFQNDFIRRRDERMEYYRRMRKQ
jgi:uncharacterized membrane protein YjjP (DUF1212 family)